MSFYKYIWILLGVLSLGACSATGDGSEAGDLPLIMSLAGNNTEVIKTLDSSSGLLFCSAEYSGITMMDAADLSNITIMGTNYFAPTDHPVNDVFILEDFVFLALGLYNGNGGIAVVDKSDTNNISVNSQRITVGNANSKALYVSGSAGSYTAYVADENNGLQIYAITTGTSTIGAPATVSLPGAEPADIAVHTTTAYIAGKTGGVYIVTDLSGTPDVAAKISTEISDARGVAVSGDGNTLFIADRMLGVWAYDVSSPSKPSYIGNYATPGEANAVLANGDDVYVADGSNGILWLDFTTPAQPVLKKQNNVKQGVAWNVELADSFLIGAYGPEGIKVFAK